MNFLKSKRVGVGEIKRSSIDREIKSSSIDTTCKTRVNVLEYELFEEVDFMYNFSLYETENINVLVGRYLGYLF